MKLLLKHLARSVRKRPLQPVILILILTLSIATSIFAFALDDVITDNTDAAQTLKYGNANLLISVGNTSDSRFLFVNDVKDVLGESTKAVGCYEFPLILNGTGDTALTMATELEHISDIFEVKFLQYGTVTRGSLCDICFVSNDFAKAKGLSVGDTVTVEAMGYTRDYRIEGISAYPFLASYDVLVDISSLIRAFASNSSLFAAIGDAFKPCGKTYVNIDPASGMTQSEAISRLTEDARFAEKTFDDLSGIERRQSNRAVLDVLVKTSVGLSALLSAVISFCCLFILSNERMEENLILTYSGASPVLLGFMQFVEVIGYWLFSVPLGILAAVPITRIFSAFVPLQYATMSIRASAVVKSALVILSVCLLTTAFFILLSKHIKRFGETRTGKRSLLVGWLGLALAVLLILLYTVPATFRVAVYIATVTVLIGLVFVATPYILRWITSPADRDMSRARTTTAISFRYALKNIHSLKLLHNIGRLCALIVSILLTVGSAFVCAKGWAEPWKEVFDADYAVFNTTESCYEKVASCEGSASVIRAYLNQSNSDVVISADHLSAYGKHLSVNSQPTGKQAIVTQGIAHKYDLKVGDKLALELSGVPYEFTVCQIQRVAVNYIAVNCEDLQIPYNMLLVKGEEGISSAELLGNLSKATSSELTSVSTIDSLLAPRLRSMDAYTNAGKILVLVFLVFSLIGMVNIFCESLRTRKEEFGFYRLAGMSRKDLQVMQISELAVTVLLGILIGILAFAVSFVAINRGMCGYGAEIFLGIRQLFLS